MRRDLAGARRGRLALRLLGAGTACAALALGATSVFGATPSTNYDTAAAVAPDPQLKSRVPERLSHARDLDGDGVSDIFASSYLLDVNGVEDTGGVYLFSGKTRKLIYRLNPPDQQEGAHFGFYISVLGDVNADGLDDLAVGAESLDVAGNKDQGRLYVFDGPSGRLLYHIDNPHPQA
ncbi:MAG: integrin alpha, partial [Actinobacteria bacterium]|nr:integrin alpha [Actinomycetota bacterium]